MTTLSAPILSQTALFDQILTQTFSTMSLHVLKEWPERTPPITVGPLGGKGAGWEDRWAAHGAAERLMKELGGLITADGSDVFPLSNGWAARPRDSLLHGEDGIFFRREGPDIVVSVVKSSSRGVASIESHVFGRNEAPLLSGQDEERRMTEMELTLKYTEGLSGLLGRCRATEMSGKILNDLEFPPQPPQLISNSLHWRKQLNDFEMLDLRTAYNDRSLRRAVSHSVTLSARLFCDSQETGLLTNDLFSSLWNYLTPPEGSGAR